ncbi:MAG: MotA/TolQ/ExbB proton channel family protein [SAR86 cluster bacterium]|jgi:biopolymer transport protein ExbB|nr:MotA/TolQ/ExbB proton channel family protein [SAR86 cluster bacterium]
MNKIKLFIFLLSFGLVSSTSFAEDGEEAVQPSNPQELLEIVKQGQFADTQQQRDRESQFRNEKNKQAKMLSDAKDERARLEREAARLEQKFEANEALLVVAEEQLRERLGSLNEIFGHLAGNTTEARNIMEQSITAAQFGKDREEFMRALGSKMNEGIKLASIDELETLWYELQREINASGEVVKFNAEVITTDGNVENRDVVRVGNFNVVSDGQYLTYSPTRGAYAELGSQPAGRYTAQSSDILNGETFPVQFAVDPTGPQGGSLLASLISMPSTWGKMQEGGFVGTVLMIIGSLATLLFIWRFYELWTIRGSVIAQAGSATLTDDNALGRILKIAEDDKEADTETLELKMAEQILKERPTVEGLNWVLKIVSVVAPLMGLFGTIIGMIETFTMITLFGTGDPKTMASGISTALVTTWLGLMVAIPTTFMYATVNNISRGVLGTIEEHSTGMAAKRSEGTQ